MKRAMFLLVLVGTGAISASVGRAQQDPAAIAIQKVTSTLFIVTGGRGSGGQSNTISGCTTVAYNMANARNDIQRVYEESR